MSFFLQTQPPKTILAQVQLQQRTPIHTISFNCNDSEANNFLSTLAADSRGRYHYYSDDTSYLPEGPVPYESEDVRLLKEEMKKGKDDLSKLGKLREQCALLDWSQNGHDEDGCGKDHGIRWVYIYMLHQHISSNIFILNISQSIDRVIDCVRSDTASRNIICYYSSNTENSNKRLAIQMIGM